MNCIKQFHKFSNLDVNLLRFGGYSRWAWIQKRSDHLAK